MNKTCLDLLNKWHNPVAMICEVPRPIKWSGTSKPLSPEEQQEVRSAIISAKKALDIEGASGQLKADLDGIIEDAEEAGWIADAVFEAVNDVRMSAFEDMVKAVSRCGCKK